MSKPETKTVLGRVFTKKQSVYATWLCRVKSGTVELRDCGHTGAANRWEASLIKSGCGLVGVDASSDEYIETGNGPTEADAILALQATLRKMAELEVVNG